MEFGGPGGPVFPTREEQALIDKAHRQIRDKNWPPDQVDVTQAKLSITGLGYAIGALFVIGLSIYLCIWMVG